MKIDLTRSLEVPLNRGLFEWVIENLVKNAVDAMNGRGIIELNLTTDPENTAVVLFVTDEGKGIPDKHLKNIFRPGFSTKKNYTHKRRGWGLGLTLVKRIVENYHNGRITVKSELGVGTRFRVSIPKEQKVSLG